MSGRFISSNWSLYPLNCPLLHGNVASELLCHQSFKMSHWPLMIEEELWFHDYIKEKHPEIDDVKNPWTLEFAPMEASKMVLQLPVTESQFAAILIFCISLTGFFLNTIVAIFTRKLKTMNNPFGRLMASQATGEAALSAVFAFYFSPMVFFDVKLMEEHSRHAGWINLIAYDICIWSHLFIALNRMCAIVFPLKYDKYFSVKNTSRFIVVSWIIPFVTAIVLYKLYDCDLYYVSAFWVFGFTDNKVCNFISWNIDFYKDISIVIVIAVVDTITIFEVHRAARRNIGQSTAQQIQRRRREVNFLKQAVLQGVVFVIELLTYFIFAWWFTDKKWVVFCMTTLAWNIVHTTDPIIIISLNREFRKFFTSPKFMLHSIHNSETPTPHGSHQIGSGTGTASQQ